MAGLFDDLGGLSDGDLWEAYRGYKQEREELRGHLEDLKRGAVGVTDNGRTYAQGTKGLGDLNTTETRSALGANGREIKACERILRGRGFDPDSDPSDDE